MNTITPLDIQCVNLHARNRTGEAKALRTEALQRELVEREQERSEPCFPSEKVISDCQAACQVIATFVCVTGGLVVAINFVKWMGWV